MKFTKFIDRSQYSSSQKNSVRIRSMIEKSFAMFFHDDTLLKIFKLVNNTTVRWKMLTAEYRVTSNYHSLTITKLSMGGHCYKCVFSFGILFFDLTNFLHITIDIYIFYKILKSCTKCSLYFK